MQEGHGRQQNSVLWTLIPTGHNLVTGNVESATQHTDTAIHTSKQRKEKDSNNLLHTTLHDYGHLCPLPGQSNYRTSNVSVNCWQLATRNPSLPAVCSLKCTSELPAVCNLKCTNELPAVCNLKCTSELPAVCTSELSAVCNLKCTNKLSAICNLKCTNEPQAVCNLKCTNELQAVCNIINSPVKCCYLQHEMHQ